MTTCGISEIDKSLTRWGPAIQCYGELIPESINAPWPVHARKEAEQKVLLAIGKSDKMVTTSLRGGIPK